MYNKKVMGIFQNPSNIGELKGTDVGAGVAVNSVFGETVKIYIKVENDKVIDAKFKAFGNVATIACSSMATELVLGQTLEELKEYKADDVRKVLGGIPSTKEYSITLVKEAVVDAVNDYNKKQIKLMKKNKSAK